MRILLDETLPHTFVGGLRGLRVSTVQAEGWSGTKTGELLRRAHQRLDALLTMDRGLQYQQNLSGLGVRIVVIHARSNRMAHLSPLIDSILKVLDGLSPGNVREVGA